MISFSTVWKNILFYRDQITQLEQENTELKEALAGFILPAPPEYPVITLSGMEVFSEIKKATTVDSFLLDNSYRVVDERDFLRFVEWYKPRIPSYLDEYRDCDNFTLDFMDSCLKWGSNCSMLTGQAPFGPHAWSGVLVYREGGVLAFTQVEPQNGYLNPVYSPTWIMANG